MFNCCSIRLKVVVHFGFWATVCKTACYILSDRCLSVCLSVCPVLSCLSDGGLCCCMEWSTAAPPPLSKFAGAGFACVHIICGPCLLWPKGWMDQDAIWYRCRPPPRPHCIPSPKGAQPPIFGLCLLWLNSWMDLDATW